MRLDLELEVTYFPWLHTRLLSRMRFFLFFFSSPSRRAANLSRAKREEGISPRIIPCRVIWQGTRARNNDPCTVIGFNGAGAKPRGRSWPLTRPIPWIRWIRANIYIYIRVHTYSCVFDFHENVQGTTRVTERSVTFAAKEARFRSMNLDIRGLRFTGWKFIRVYSSVERVEGDR